MGVVDVGDWIMDGVGVDYYEDVWIFVVENGFECVVVFDYGFGGGFG